MSFKIRRYSRNRHELIVNRFLNENIESNHSQKNLIRNFFSFSYSAPINTLASPSNLYAFVLGNGTSLYLYLTMPSNFPQPNSYIYNVFQFIGAENNTISSYLSSPTAEIIDSQTVRLLISTVLQQSHPFYKFQVSYYDVYGNTSGLSLISNTVQPPYFNSIIIPGGLQASSLGGMTGKITLSFVLINNPAIASSYNIYIYTSDGNPNIPFRKDTGITTSPHTITGLSDGTVYYFTISSLNLTGQESPQSAPSNSVLCYNANPSTPIPRIGAGFTSNGVYQIKLDKPYDIQLYGAGGGGGGSWSLKYNAEYQDQINLIGGGGGGGGIIKTYRLPADTYTIYIGKGGVGGNANINNIQVVNYLLPPTSGGNGGNTIIYKSSDPTNPILISNGGNGGNIDIKNTSGQSLATSCNITVDNSGGSGGYGGGGGGIALDTNFINKNGFNITVISQKGGIGVNENGKDGTQYGGLGGQGTAYAYTQNGGDGGGGGGSISTLGGMGGQKLDTSANTHNGYNGNGYGCGGGGGSGAPQGQSPPGPGGNGGNGADGALIFLTN